ncbi:MAG: PIG-L family deacetylase [Clostridia bacterium]
MPPFKRFAASKTAFVLALCITLAACCLPRTACAKMPVLPPGARELTKACTFLTAGKHSPYDRLYDGSYASAFAAVDGTLQITAPMGEQIATLVLCFADDPKAWEIEVQTESGGWQLLQNGETAYAHVCMQLPKPHSQALRVRVENAPLQLTELRVFTAGHLPNDVQRWQPTLGKADLLLLVGHPDDEFIFFGGCIPWYVAQQKRVLVAYMTCRSFTRRAELLNGLWTAGIRHYPVIGPFRDRYTRTLDKMYDEWGQAEVDSFLIKLIRAHQPEVMVTHATGGEYGHGAHRVCADAALRVFDKTADPLYMPQHTKAYGTWQVKKLYLHLYPQNALTMNWLRPIGGETALSIAQAAFAQHVSQQHFQVRDEEHPRYNGSLFGLTKTTVGPDAQQDDFFENIPPNSACTRAEGAN